MQLLQRLIGDDERLVLHLVLQGPDSFRGTIDHHHSGAALGGQVLNHQPPHLSRAHDEHSGGQRAGTGKFSEGQLDRGGADGDGAGGDVGLAADAFAGLDGVFEEAIDDFAEAAARLSDPDDLLHLGENLPLSQDERVQPGGHLEEVPDGVAVPKHEQVLPEFFH